MTHAERKTLKTMQLQVERLEAEIQDVRNILARQHEEADEEIRHCREGLGLPINVPIRRVRA